MSEVPSLAGQPVSLENCWTFILNQPEIFEEFVYFFLKQLLQVYLEQAATSEEVEDYLNQFSEVSKLSSVEQFERWLETNDDDYDSFMERTQIAIAMKKFRQQINNYRDIKSKFEARTYLFDYFVLSRLIFTDEAIAHTVYEQIKKYPELFQEIFQTYSTCNGVKLRGWKEIFIRANLPDELQSVLPLQFKKSGSHLFKHLIDQLLETDQGWYLIYIHQFIPMG